jgi:hypothetical protein
MKYSLSFFASKESMIDFDRQEFVLLKAYAQAKARNMSPTDHNFDQSVDKISQEYFGTKEYAVRPVSAVALHAAFHNAGLLDTRFTLTQKGEEALAEFDKQFSPLETAPQP